MCGRYTLTATAPELARAFRVDLARLAHRPRYNIAPTQPVPVILRETPDADPTAPLARWSFRLRIGGTDRDLINARSETAHEKRTFRGSFAARRCLVLADGWYEWQPTDAGKAPHWFHREDGRPFAFAGLWERWEGEDGEPGVCCTILTAEATAPHRAIHHRRPVVLDRAARRQWLDAGMPRDVLRAILRLEAPGIAVHPVSTLVNSPANDGPACIEAVGA